MADVPSSDPGFPGNAKPEHGAYDRYLFGSHSLRRWARRYHDATFNRRYYSPTAFIDWNITSWTRNTLTTDGGVVIEILPANSYDGWPGYEYAPGFLPLAGIDGQQMSLGHQGHSVAAPDTAGDNLQFTHVVSYSLVDDDGDGFADALGVDAEFAVYTTGEYVIMGFLRRGGETISARPRYYTPSISSFHFDGSPGTYSAEVEFSGEDIYQYGNDGPFDIELMGISSFGLEDTLDVQSPAYSHTDFGELDAEIASAADAGVDLDYDALFDVLRMTLEISVRNPGSFSIVGGLFSDTTYIANQSVDVSLPEGSSYVDLDFVGTDIRKTSLDGPYEVGISLRDSLGDHLSSLVDTAQSYSWADFEISLLTPTGTHDDMGVDLNANDLFDLLRFTFDADAETSGTFIVTAWLAEQGVGGESGVTFATAVDTVTLVSGTQSITLDFSGPTINDHGVDGPYAVTFVEILDESLGVADELTLGYPTQSYQADESEPGPPVIAYLDSYADAMVDTSGNGLGEFLVASLLIEVSSDTVILGFASLYDSHGRFITNGVGVVETTSETPVDLDVYFDGRFIFGNLENGPYFVRDVCLYPSRDVTMGIQVSEVGETGPYCFTEFEPAAVITGIVEEDHGVYAIGAEVRSADRDSSTSAIDWVDHTGWYHLVFLDSVTALVSVTYEGISAWDVDLNGEFIGTGESFWVDAQVGEVDTLNFRPSGTAGSEGLSGSGAEILFQNRPNPFSNTTEISFSLARTAPVHFRIYDVKGRLLRTLIDGQYIHGFHTVTWDGTDSAGKPAPSGVYFYRLTTLDRHRIGRMTLLR